MKIYDFLIWKYIDSKFENMNFKYENMDENAEVGQRTPEDWWQGRPPGCWDAADGTGCQKNWKCCKCKKLKQVAKKTENAAKERIC